jgi:hypothetical protein
MVGEMTSHVAPLNSGWSMGLNITIAGSAKLSLTLF